MAGVRTINHATLVNVFRETGWTWVQLPSSPQIQVGPVVELVYTQHLKCCANRLVGSSPTWTTVSKPR